VRVVIGEDAVLLQVGLVQVLEEAGESVLAAVGDAPSLIEAVERHRPDVAIIDVRMPPGMTDDGLQAALEIRRRWPETAILVFSQYIEQAFASELLVTGTEGLGYLLKDRVAEVAEFVDAVRRVGRGGTALDPEVVAQLLARSDRVDPLARLTPRERQVLALMAEGRSNQAIAATLVISDGAVEKHVSSVFTKLGLSVAGPDNRRVLAVLRWLDA
jgi:DNA-binding NarL/FixJ family response regulator